MNRGKFTCEKNLLWVMAVNRDVLARPESLDDANGVVLDLDSSANPGRGQQEGNVCNGGRTWP